MVAAELQKNKQMPHFDHFPRPGEIDPYIASQKAWFMAIIAIIKKVKNTLQEEIILNEVSLGGSPPIKGTLITGQASM